MSRRHAPTGRLRRIVPRAGGAVLAVLTLVSCTGEEPTSPRTATVQRASVTSGVSATGSMSAIIQQNMGFANGGQLTNVFVKVGDRVEAGQVLATVDDFAWRQALAQQQGQLASQQALLDKLINSPAVEGAQDSADQAKNILEATRRQAKAQLELDETAIRNAERQLDVDKKALDEAKDRLEADKRACGDDDDDSSPSSRAGSSGTGSGSTGSGSSGSGSSSDSDDSESDESSESSGNTATPTSM